MLLVGAPYFENPLPRKSGLRCCPELIFFFFFFAVFLDGSSEKLVARTTVLDHEKP